MAARGLRHEASNPAPSTHSPVAQKWSYCQLAAAVSAVRAALLLVDQQQVIGDRFVYHSNTGTCTCTGRGARCFNQRGLMLSVHFATRGLARHVCVTVGRHGM